MNTHAAAPTLDSFLKVHGLTMASFDSKSLDEALRMTGLDDRALSGLGDAHRDRSLIVRGALLDRLARAKVDNNDSDPTPYPDEDTGDENTDGDDESPSEPRDKSKKKAKPAKADDEDDAETLNTDAALETLAIDGYERGVRATADAIILAWQRARRPEPPPKPSASDDRVIAAEIRAGYPITAAQIDYCARKARGLVAPEPPPKGSYARMILDADRKARNLPPLEG